MVIDASIKPVTKPLTQLQTDLRQNGYSGELLTAQLLAAVWISKM